MSILISSAFAAAGGPQAGAADGTFSLIMIIAIFGLIYFMLIHPQKKRAKEHQNLMDKLKKGDEVVTAGGILGRISSLDDNYLRMTIAEGVEMVVQRNAVNTVLPKGTLKSL